MKQKLYGVRLYGPESAWVEAKKKKTGKGYTRIIEELIINKMTMEEKKNAVNDRKRSRN